MSKFNNLVIREKGRCSAVLSGVSGNYAEQRVTIGAPVVGQPEQSYMGVTAVAESPFVAGATVELWVRRAADGSRTSEQMTDADYTLSGLATLTAAGMVSWSFGGGVVSCQVRVKSGAVVGTQNVSVFAT